MDNKPKWIVFYHNSNSTLPYTNQKINISTKNPNKSAIVCNFQNKKVS